MGPLNKADSELRNLYPELSESERLIAEGKLTDYAGLIIRICRRTANDANARYPAVLTDRESDSTIDAERSKNKTDSPNK
jgi:hypothetical protein